MPSVMQEMLEIDQGPSMTEVFASQANGKKCRYLPTVQSSGNIQTLVVSWVQCLEKLQTNLWCSMMLTIFDMTWDKSCDVWIAVRRADLRVIHCTFWIHRELAAYEALLREPVLKLDEINLIFMCFPCLSKLLGSATSFQELEQLLGVVLRDE